MRARLVAAALAAAPLPVLAQQAPVPPIAFTERTLVNGLQVYAIRDATTPNVSVQVWYKVGGKDDPRGRSGFAHMFEHLMFKATRNLVPEQMDRLTEDVGGYNNASTDADYTNYYEVVPANHLERLLFAESDRMASLVVEPTTFASERDVVKEELRQGTMARPYGKLFSIYWPEISYQRHPYARPVIGSLTDLESASIDDVRAFHATYYRPDNAVLVVAGNFDAGQLDRWIDRYFGGIARPDRPIPRVAADEPVRTTPTAVTVYEPNTPLPAVLISYPLPPDTHPDVPALAVLNAILSRGESSRLYQSLVYRDRLAQSAESILDMRQGPGTLAAFAIVAGGKSAGDGETALRREIARLRDAPVTAAELTEAKNEVVTDALKQRETAEGKAFVLAQSVVIDGDPRAADRRLAAIEAVTVADVQRVARTWLKDQAAATIRYLPKDGAPAGAVSDKVAVAATVVTAPLVAPAGVALVTPAPAGMRKLPPPPGAPLATALPPHDVARLANGLTVVTVSRPGVPLVTAELVADRGVAADPDARAGLAKLTATLVTKGTTTRSASQIASGIEALGATLDSSSDWDGTTIGATVRTSALPAALAIIADVARRPTLSDEELGRARAQAIDDVTVDLKNPATLAGLVANRAVFGAGRYGQPASGIPSTLTGVTRGDVQRTYAATWQPARTTLVVTGDVTPDRARTLADQAFGDWRAKGDAAAEAPAAAAPAPRVIVVDMPDAGQAGVVVARRAIARSDPRWDAAEVADTVLGGGFSARLNQEIRIKRGLAYGARSDLAARRDIGPATARTQTKNATADEAVALIVGEMRRLGSDPVPADELTARKAALLGEFGRTAETTEGLASLFGDAVVERVPLDQLAGYAARIAAVTPAQVRTAATVLDPAAASIVVVGDAKQFVDDLRKVYPKLEVVPAAALKLDRAALR